MLRAPGAAFCLSLTTKRSASPQKRLFVAPGSMSGLRRTLYARVQQPGQVHALVTDIRMPSGQPHGFALARIARFRHPEVVVAYTTGYPDAVGENPEFVDGSAVFEKPIAWMFSLRA
jgi:hypothetical protein